MSGRQAFVAMMKSAYFRERHYLAFLRTLDPPGLRSVLVQTQMCSAGVVISEITFKDAVQVSSAQHYDVIQTFAPDGTNQPFDVRGLPGRTWRDPDFLQSETHGALLEFQAVNAVAIAEQVFRS